MKFNTISFQSFFVTIECEKIQKILKNHIVAMLRYKPVIYS